MSLRSEYDGMNAFINTHGATTTETKIPKNRIMIMSINFTINTSTLTKKKYDSEKVKDEEKEGVTINSLK